MLGLDDLLEQLREAMRARYREVNLRGALAEMREKLEELLDLERETLDGLDDQERAGRKRKQLDDLPPRLSDALEALADYAFENAEAESLYEALLDELENIRNLEDFERRYGDLFHGPRSLELRRGARAHARDGGVEAPRGAASWAATSTRIDPEQLGELLGAGALRSFQLLQEMMRAIAQARATSRSGRGARRCRRRACGRSASSRCATSTRACCATGPAATRPTSAAPRCCGPRRRVPTATATRWRSTSSPRSRRPWRGSRVRRSRLAPDDFEVYAADRRPPPARPCSSST